MRHLLVIATFMAKFSILWRRIFEPNLNSFHNHRQLKVRSLKYQAALMYIFEELTEISLHSFHTLALKSKNWSVKTINVYYLHCFFL